MSIHVVVEDGGREGDLVWDFSDDEYEQALAMFHSLVYENRDKGILLKDGNDAVWLKKATGAKTAWRKITAAVLLKSGRFFRDGSRFGNERWPGRGTKPPAS